MTIKARKRIKHVKEDHFDQQGSEQDSKESSAGGMGKVSTGDGAVGEMCSTPKSAQTLISERKGEDYVKKEETIDTKSDPNESNGPGPDNGADNKGVEVGSQGNTVTVEKTEEEKSRAEFSKHKLSTINKGAEEILSCLEPQFAHEFRVACAEYKIADIGIYLLAILNRLSKEADYYNPDFEPEWSRGEVGIQKELKCRYCGKKIPNPTKVKQLYCNNLCAKYDAEHKGQKTGLIFPDQTMENQTVEEFEQEAYLDEQKRIGE